MAEELNFFLEDGNKMIINKPEEEKIKELMTFIKKTRPEIFNKLIIIITDMSSGRNGANGMAIDATTREELNTKLKIQIKEITKHDEELIKAT